MIEATPKLKDRLCEQIDKAEVSLKNFIKSKQDAADFWVIWTFKINLI